MRTVAIIQARMGSRRLPGKVLMPVAGGRPLLAFLIGRVRQAPSLDEVVIATGDRATNQSIAALAADLGVRCLFGSEEDVLSRYLTAAEQCQADVIVRVTADNPLTDPDVIDALVEQRALSRADLAVAADLLDGAGAEVTTRVALTRAREVATTASHREHVTLIMKEHPELFRVIRWEPPAVLRRPDLSVTVDTSEDLERVRPLCELIAGQAAVGWAALIDCLERRTPQPNGSGVEGGAK